MLSRSLRIFTYFLAVIVPAFSSPPTVFAQGPTFLEQPYYRSFVKFCSITPNDENELKDIYKNNPEVRRKVENAKTSKDPTRDIYITLLQFLHDKEDRYAEVRFSLYLQAAKIDEQKFPNAGDITYRILQNFTKDQVKTSYFTQVGLNDESEKQVQTYLQNQLTKNKTLKKVDRRQYSKISVVEMLIKESPIPNMIFGEKIQDILKNHQIYEVVAANIPAENPNATYSTVLLEHPSARKDILALNAQGTKVYIDNFYTAHQYLGLFHNDQNIIVVSPKMPYHALRHERSHAEYIFAMDTANQFFFGGKRLNPLGNGASYDGMLMIEDIFENEKVSAEKRSQFESRYSEYFSLISRAKKLIDQGFGWIPYQTDLKESLAVEDQLKIFDESKVPESDPERLFTKLYRLKFQIESLKIIKAKYDGMNSKAANMFQQQTLLDDLEEKFHKIDITLKYSQFSPIHGDIVMEDGLRNDREIRDQNSKNDGQRTDGKDYLNRNGWGGAFNGIPYMDGIDDYLDAHSPWSHAGLPEDGYRKPGQFGSGFGRGNMALMSNGGSGRLNEPSSEDLPKPQTIDVKLQTIRENLAKYQGYKTSGEDMALKPTNLELYERPANFIIQGGHEGFILSPAGTGKTVGISHFLQGSIGGTNYKAFVVVPYTPLLEQTKNEIVSKTDFTSSQIGIYGDNKKDLSGQITIITERSLKNLVAEKSIDPNEYPVIILDEADLNWVTELGRETIDYFGKSIHLGYTATEGNIAQLLHHEIWRLEIGEAIEERGLLASNKSILVNVDLIDLALADRGSSYDQKTLGTLVLAHEEVIRDIGGTILKELTEDFTIPFIANFAGIDDAKKGAEILRSIGAPIDAIYSGDEDRSTTIETFEQRGTGGLTNVRVVSRGYNNKKIAVVINFAPTLSESIAIQRNRGTRFDEDNPNKLNIVVDLIYRNTLRDRNGKLKQQLYSAVAKKSQLFNKVVSQLDRSRIEKSVEDKMERVRKILAKNAVLAKQVKVFSQATEVATITNRIANPVRKLTYDQNAETIRIWNEKVRIGQLEKYVGKQYYGMLTQEIMREQKALGQSITSITQDLYSISGNMSYLRSRKVYGEDHGWLQLSDLVNAAEFKQLSPFYNGRWPKYTGKDYSAREEVQFIVANWNELISKNLLFQSFDEILDDETLETLKEKSSNDLLIIESADYAQIHKILGKEQGWPTLVDIGGTTEFNKLVASLGRVWVKKNVTLSETDQDLQPPADLKSIETKQVTIKNFPQLIDQIRNWNMAIENDQLELVTSKAIASKVKKASLEYLVHSYETFKNAYDLFGKGNHWSTPDDFINSNEFAKLGADDESRWGKILTKSGRSYIETNLRVQSELHQQKEIAFERTAPTSRQNYIPGVHAPTVRHGLEYGNWQEIMDAIPNEKISPDKLAKIVGIVVEELRKSPHMEARRTLLGLLKLLYKHENMGEHTIRGSIVDLFRYNNFSEESADSRFDIESRGFAKSVNDLAIQIISKQKSNQLYSLELRENIRLDEVARERLIDFLIRTGKLSRDSADKIIIAEMVDYGRDITKSVKQYCEARATGKQVLALISMQKDDWTQVQKIITEESPITSPWIANAVARQAYLKNQLQIVDTIVAQPGFSDAGFLLREATDRRNRNDILKFLNLSSVDEADLRYVKVYYHNDVKLINQVNTEMIRREVLRDNTFIVDFSRYKFVQRYNQSHRRIESYSDFERAVRNRDTMSLEESLEILSDQRDLFIRSAYLHDRHVKVKKLAAIHTAVELRAYWGKVAYTSSQLFDYDLIRSLFMNANMPTEQANSIFINTENNVFANELAKLNSGKSSNDDQAFNRNFRDEAGWGGTEYWNKITQPWLQLNEDLPEDGNRNPWQFGSGFGRGNQALMNNGGGFKNTDLSDEAQLERAMTALSEDKYEEAADLMKKASANSMLFSVIIPEALSENYWSIVDNALSNPNYAGENYFLIVSTAIEEKRWDTVQLALQAKTFNQTLIGIESSVRKNIGTENIKPEQLQKMMESNILGIARIFGTLLRNSQYLTDANTLKDLIAARQKDVNDYISGLANQTVPKLAGPYEQKFSQAILDGSFSEFQSAYNETGDERNNPYLEVHGKKLWEMLSNAYISELMSVVDTHRSDYLNYRDRHTSIGHYQPITVDQRGTIREWIEKEGAGFGPETNLSKLDNFEEMIFSIVSLDGAEKFFEANVDLEGTKFFIHAAQYDHIEDIKKFEKWVDSTALQRAFKMAATTGSLQTIRFLLKDPRIDEDTLQSAVAIAYEKSDPTSIQIQQILWNEYEKRTGSDDSGNLYAGPGKLFEKYMKDSPGLFNEFYSWMSNWITSKTSTHGTTLALPSSTNNELTDLQVSERIEGLRDFITRWNRLSPAQRISVYGYRVSDISDMMITDFDQVKKYFNKFDRKDWGGATPDQIENWFEHGQIPNEIFKRAGGENLEDITNYVVTRANLYSLYPISKDAQLHADSNFLTKDEYIKRVVQAIQTFDYDNLKSAWDNFGDEKFNPYLSLNRKTLWEMLGDQWVSLLSNNNRESVQHVLSSNRNLKRMTDEMKRTQDYFETYDIDVVSQENIKRYWALKKMIELVLPNRFSNELINNLSLVAIYPEGGYVQAAGRGDLKTVEELRPWMSADTIGRAFGQAAATKQREILELLANDPRINDSAYRLAAEGLGIKSTKEDIQALKLSVASLIKKMPLAPTLETTPSTEVRRAAFAVKTSDDPQDQFYYQKFVAELDLNQDLRNSLADLFQEYPDLAQRTANNLKKKFLTEDNKVIYQAYLDILKLLYDRSIHLDSNYDELKKHFREIAPTIDVEGKGDATKYEIVEALSKEGKPEKFKGEVTNYFKNLLGFKRMPNQIDMTKLGYDENKIKGRVILDILYTKDVVDRVISQHTFYDIQKTNIIKPIKYGSYDLPALKHPNLDNVLDELSRMNTNLVVDSFLLTDFDAGYYSRLANPLQDIQKDVIIVSMTVPYYVLMHELSHLEFERAAQKAQMFLVNDHSSLDGLLDVLIRKNAIGGDPKEIDSVDQYKTFKSKYPEEFKLLMHARELYESGLGNLYDMQDINETLAFEKETIEFDKAGLPADHPDRLRGLVYIIDFQINGLKKRLDARNISEQQKNLLDRLSKDRANLVEKYKNVYQNLRNNRLDLRDFADVMSMLDQHNLEQKNRPDLQIHNRSDYDRIGPDFGYPKLETLAQFVHQDSQEQFKKDVVTYSSDPSNYKMVTNGFSLDWIPKNSWAGEVIDKMNHRITAMSSTATQAVSDVVSSFSSDRSSNLTVVPNPNVDQIQEATKRLLEISDELSHSAKDAEELKKGIKFHQAEIERLTKILEKTEDGQKSLTAYDLDLKDFQLQSTIAIHEQGQPTVIQSSIKEQPSSAPISRKKEEAKSSLQTVNKADKKTVHSSILAQIYQKVVIQGKALPNEDIQELHEELVQLDNVTQAQIIQVADVSRGQAIREEQSKYLAQDVMNLFQTYAENASYAQIQQVLTQFPKGYIHAEQRAGDPRLKGVSLHNHQVVISSYKVAEIIFSQQPTEAASIDHINVQIQKITETPEEKIRRLQQTQEKQDKNREEQKHENKFQEERL